MIRAKKPKASEEEIRAIIERVHTSAPPEEWPTYGMAEEEVIERCREVREQLWEEKLARHAHRS